MSEVTVPPRHTWDWSNVTAPDGVVRTLEGEAVPQVVLDDVVAPDGVVLQGQIGIAWHNQHPNLWRPNHPRFPHSRPGCCPKEWPADQWPEFAEPPARDSRTERTAPDADGTTG